MTFDTFIALYFVLLMDLLLVEVWNLLSMQISELLLKIQKWDCHKPTGVSFLEEEEHKP